MSKSINQQFAEGDLSNITTYQAGVLQASMNRILQKESDKVLNPYGISKMHWLIIGTVLDAGEAGIRLTDLANSLSTTMSYITTAINLLELKHMVVRTDSDTDNRTKLISIDPDFAPKCDLIEATLRNALRKSIYIGIDPQEFRVYMKVMFQLSTLDQNN